MRVLYLTMVALMSAAAPAVAQQSPAWGNQGAAGSDQGAMGDQGQAVMGNQGTMSGGQGMMGNQGMMGGPMREMMERGRFMEGMRALAAGTFFRIRKGDTEIDMHCPPSANMQLCVQAGSAMMNAFNQSLGSGGTSNSAPSGTPGGHQ